MRLRVDSWGHVEVGVGDHPGAGAGKDGEARMFCMTSKCAVANLMQ